MEGGGYNHFPRTGNGMAQLEMFCDTTYNIADTTVLGVNAIYYRDYLQGRLYSRLISGHIYCVSFYVVLTRKSAFGINHIGAYMDDGSMDTTNWCGFPQTSHIPQVYGTDIISDTLNWTKIQGTFTSNGTENFITIGNFFDSAHTAKTPTNFWWSMAYDNSIYSWYLVDDVSVIPIDAVADAGPDRVTTTAGDSVQIGDTTGYLPCQWYANGVLIDSNIAGLLVHPTVTTRYVMVLDVCGHITTDTAVVWVFPSGVQNINYSDMDSHQSYKLYPNPNNGNIVLMQFLLDTEPLKIDVYNAMGNLVTQIPLQFAGYEQVISITDIPTGLYLMRITNAKNHSFNLKFLKE